MKKTVTEITLINSDLEKLKIRIDPKDDDISELQIEDKTFWFGRKEWKCIAEVLQEICEED